MSITRFIFLAVIFSKDILLTQADDTCQDCSSFHPNCQGCFYGTVCSGLTSLPDHNQAIPCSSSQLLDYEIKDGVLPTIPARAFRGFRFGYKENGRYFLSMTNCSISYVDDDAFIDTSIPEQVTTLKLSSNQLTAVPKAIFRFKKLINLELDDNKLVTIPFDFHLYGLLNLTFINLEDNAFTTVPNNICGFPKMSRILLGYNPIEKDLSQFLTTFIQCRLQEPNLEITWPQPNMTCTCKSLGESLGRRDNFNLFVHCRNKIFDRDQGGNPPHIPLTCGDSSETVFQGEDVRDLYSQDVWEKCPEYAPTTTTPQRTTTRSTKTSDAPCGNGITILYIMCLYVLHEFSA